jgi:hypothetical protein
MKLCDYHLLGKHRWSYMSNLHSLQQLNDIISKETDNILRAVLCVKKYFKKLQSLV